MVGKQIKLVLAMNKKYYEYFCRQHHLDPREFRYVHNWGDMCGYWIDTPVILLEHYERNRNYSVEMIHDMGRRFETIRLLTEAERYKNYYVPVQYMREGNHESIIV